MPKVSVCVITFNHEAYIGECLQSIFAQKTNYNFEVIVGDDCSKDGTAEVIREFAKKYPNKITTIFHKQNIGGGCNNYRTVHQMARGEYIAHMDGDDMMEPGKLQLQSDFLDQHIMCSMVSHSCYRLGLDGRKSMPSTRHFNSIVGMNELLEKQCFFTHSSKMYRSSIRDNSWAIKQENFIDFELHVECAGEGNIGYINKPLVTYRVLENSITKGSSAQKFKLLKFTLRGYDLALKNGASTRKVTSGKCALLYKSAVYFLRNGDEKNANQCFDLFDQTPVIARPSLYAILLCGNIKAIRMPMCKFISLFKRYPK